MSTAASDNIRSRPRSGRHGRARTVAAALLGAILALFAAFNSQTVRVHWIFTTTGVPLIVVIFGCGLIGAAVAWLVERRRRARTSRPQS